MQLLQEQQQGNLSYPRGTAQRKCETGGLLLIEREHSTLRDTDRTEMYDHGYKLFNYDHNHKQLFRLQHNLPGIKCTNNVITHSDVNILKVI